MEKLFFYVFLLFSLTSIIYGMSYDFMTGAEIHNDFYLTSFVCFSIFFIVLKLALRV